MNLHRVRPGYFLHWPPIIDPINLQWLMPGNTIDLDDQFTALCAKGQEFKLDPAPDAEAATPIENTRFLMLQREFNAKAAEANGKPEAATAIASDPSIPKPDVRPKKEEKKHGALPSPVSQGSPR
jgi:hypothetical protein